MKKILYISYDGMTDPLGQSQVLPYISALSAKGYSFTLISFEKKERFEKDKNIIQSITAAAGISWKPLMFSKNPPFLSKVYDRWKLKRQIKKIFSNQHFDMVHCRSYVAAEIGLWAKKKYKAKFLFDMRGFWADEKVDNGQWNLNNPLYKKVYRHFKNLESDFLLNADAVISLTQAAKDELVRKTEYKDVLIDVIPCCADLDHFNYNRIDAESVQHLRATLNISAEKKVITYLGSVGGWYMIKEMFAFYNRLISKYPEFVMLVMTKDNPEMVKQQAAIAGIPEDKIIVSYAGRNDLPVYIALSSCSIFFIRPTYSKIASSPTKHAELMGMGVPVICNNIGDTGFVIQQTGSGIVVDSFTNEAYDNAIEKIDALLAIPKEKIRQAAFDYFDLEKGAAAYLSIYKRILNNGSGE